MIHKIKNLHKNYRHYSDHDLVIFSRVVKLSLFLLWFVFIWFAVIFYPQLQKNFMPKVASSVTQASSQFNGFPVKTQSFIINHEFGSTSYEVIVLANTKAQFLEGRNQASIYLKNLLSLESLCTIDVTFRSGSNLKVPMEYLTDNCN